MCVREFPFPHPLCRVAARDAARHDYQLRGGRRLPIEAYTMERGLAHNQVNGAPQPAIPA
jgi:hypothetical protein